MANTVLANLVPVPQSLDSILKKVDGTINPIT